jgi:hypothetical protein
MLRKIAIIIAIFFFCLGLDNCKSQALPTTPYIPDCQRFHTGTLTVSNQSKTGQDYEVLIGQKSPGTLLKLGESKSFELACLGSTPIVVQFYDLHGGILCSFWNEWLIECQTLSLSCDK